MMFTRGSLLSALTAPIVPLYGVREARCVALVAAEWLTGLSRAALLSDPQAARPELDAQRVRRTVDELREGRPVQYVTGRCEFCALELHVREGVLIPRPETEELVAWMVAECSADARVLDAGTGSGCIALALARGLKGARITALDNSEQALAVARENAARLALPVEVVQGDLLFDWAERFEPGSFDAVVSNPPYVPLADRAAMHRNVVEYEPAEALFVPDADPLLFYRAVARGARRLLREGGTLWFEIYEGLAAQTRSLLEAEGYGCVELREDMNRKPRMVRCRRI